MKYAFIIILLLFIFLPVSIIFAQTPNNNNACCLCQEDMGPACLPLGAENNCSELAIGLSLDDENCSPISCDSPTCTGGGEKESGSFNLEPIKFRLNLPIPGLEEFSQGEGMEVNSQTITKYFGGLYRFFVSIAGIVAVFMITMGGVYWLFSGGNDQKITKAKEIILGAVFGLLLALSSYMILFNINPALVEFEDLPVPAVVMEMSSLVTGACPSESQVKIIPSIDKVSISSNCSNPRLTQETIDKLKVASEKLNSNETLVITSAYRTYKKQKELYDCWKQGLCPNVAAKPSCSAPHQTGQAMDVCIQIGSRNTCGYITQSCNGGCAGVYNLGNDQKRLQEVMQQAGFSRYCGEWWHFESTAMSKACGPGQY
ncbi:D-alanyl-D-alanine carboxypeptidase family protein [Patescibacteria group bacterium]|nr:D-alanyl-D-alanine carboxypeptidase family protein [Patescibacteria group bacterium]